VVPVNTAELAVAVLAARDVAPGLAGVGDDHADVADVDDRLRINSTVANRRFT